ncbi:MAG: hypothetical protein PHU64_07600 [Candidatus Omnitrophica bacterium]|nr:hypothetical protein [Candidatus Omnitrophota bacterium]MDD5430534.1 hypothetical protein [Candidatus Omnitrophota bacterium]
MKEKVFNKNRSRYIVFAVIFLVVIIIIGVASALRADVFYARAVSLKVPELDSEKKGYYKRVLSLISEAIKFEKENSDYYAQKADYIVSAISGGLGKDLAINEKQAEDLYKKAIEINPVNSEYHLKLGWFYMDKDDSQAGEEIKKAVELYPNNYQIYMYLAEYYFEKKDIGKAFSNAILAFHYSKGGYYLVARQLKDDARKVPGVVLDDTNGEFKLIVYPANSEFCFKELGQMQVAVPLKIRVYIKDSQAKVNFYQRGSFYGKFEKTEVTSEYTVFELDLERFPPRTWLDDFEIRTDGYVNIEKVEVIQKF